MNNYNGLTDNEILENRKKYGTNEISKNKSNGFLSLLLESLGDPIIKILLIALAVKVIFLFKSSAFTTIGIINAINKLLINTNDTILINNFFIFIKNLLNIMLT